jgi:hypothetical protein
MAVLRPFLSGDPDSVDSLGCVQESSAALESFNSSFMALKEKLATVDGPSAFTLNNQAVMPRFIRLTRQMDEIKPLLQMVIEVNRFDKTEVGGIHGCPWPAVQVAA